MHAKQSFSRSLQRGFPSALQEADCQSRNEPGMFPSPLLQQLGSAAGKESWMLLLGSVPAWRSNNGGTTTPRVVLLILPCSSLPGERENPRGSAAHASHFPGRREHLHHRLQPHERAAAGPVEPGTAPNCTHGLPKAALQPWGHGMGWAGWDVKANPIP